jgi:hypothetical protein
MCCETVCAIDSFCCEIEWDALCVDSAVKSCPELCDRPPPPPPGGCPGEGDCCKANGTPGCEDETCCLAVCAIDTFCCDTEWDQLCAGTAADTCSKLCDGPPPPPPADCPGEGDCCKGNGTPGCDSEECCNEVCAFDSFCCELEWDQFCADQAAKVCADCGGPPPKDSTCCQANQTPGCDDPGCEALVCEADPFCCESQWDGVCAGVAADLCKICGADVGCVGDTNSDGVVNVTDLTNVILFWATDGQGEGIDADTDGDGIVGVGDLTEVILNWGPCS